MGALIFLVVVASSIWVGVDASKRDWDGYSFADSATKWVIGTLLVWVVVFPVYLAKRNQAPLKGAQQVPVPAAATVIAPPVVQAETSDEPKTSSNSIHIPVWAGVLFVVCAVVAVVAYASGSSAGHSSPDGTVGGSLSKSCDGFSCTSPDAARALDSSQVWCTWRGATVVVHALLTNNMAASVALSIVPKYTIENGGQHGTSMGSEIPISLAAGQSMDWTGSAGQPEGVATGTPIGDCKPHLHDIDISNITP